MSLTDLKNKFSKGEVTKPDFINQAHEFHQNLFEYSRVINGTDISKIEITDNKIVATTRNAGTKLIVNQSDKRTAPVEILNFNSYETEVAAMMSRLISDGHTVFDVGANIGYYSLDLAKRFPKSKIYSFEPIPSTYEALLKNVELNGLKNIKPCPFGFSLKDEVKTFYFYSSGSVNASAANLTKAQDVEEIKCQVKSLDNFTRSENISVDFIKCDVEGAELFVFQGGLETLKRDKPVILSEMLRKWSSAFNYHPNQIIQWLGEIGYQCFVIKDHKLSRFYEMDENTVETNYFFLDPRKHSEKLKVLPR